MKALDFKRAKTGMVVTRSEHWNRERCVKPGTEPQLGVIVGHEFFDDKLCGVVCFPVIHWEGESTGSVTHPANVVPYREKDRVLPEIEMVA